MVALRTDELDEMKQAIADGKLLPDAIEKHFLEEEQRVFGHGFRRDRDGVPVEQGIGSAAQPSENSVRAYETFCKNEPDYQTNLARMRADLAAYNKKKAAQGAQR